MQENEHLFSTEPEETSADEHEVIEEFREELEALSEEAPKPKRTRKKKAEEPAEIPEVTEPSEYSAEDAPVSGEPITDAEVESILDSSSDTETIIRRPARRGIRASGIVTLEAGGMVDTEQTAADIAWHTIHNAYRTHRTMKGTFGGIETLENGVSVGVVEYSGYRIVIPLKEMTLDMPTNLHGEAYSEMLQQYIRRLGNMLGAEIDFTIRGIDSTTHSVVASRREAMLKKRQAFYIDPTTDGGALVREGRIAQARIIGVHEKVLRVEIFGVETTIPARDLSWQWIGDVNEHYAVGDTVLVRITELECTDAEHITVRAEVKSLDDTARDKLKLCRPQSKYAGKVVNVHKGAVYIRLTNGVNAIAHSCYDRRMPGKKDDVSFVVTRIDEERGIAMGLISRIIKQNI